MTRRRTLFNPLEESGTGIEDLLADIETPGVIEAVPESEESMISKLTEIIPTSKRRLRDSYSKGEKLILAKKLMDMGVDFEDPRLVEPIDPKAIKNDELLNIIWNKIKPFVPAPKPKKPKDVIPVSELTPKPSLKKKKFAGKGPKKGVPRGPYKEDLPMVSMSPQLYQYLLEMITEHQREKPDDKKLHRFTQAITQKGRKAWGMDKDFDQLWEMYARANPGPSVKYLPIRIRRARDFYPKSMKRFKWGDLQHVMNLIVEEYSRLPRTGFEPAPISDEVIDTFERVEEKVMNKFDVRIPNEAIIVVGKVKISPETGIVEDDVAAVLIPLDSPTIGKMWHGLDPKTKRRIQKMSIVRKSGIGKQTPKLVRNPLDLMIIGATNPLEDVIETYDIGAKYKIFHGTDPLSFDKSVAEDGTDENRKIKLARIGKCLDIEVIESDGTKTKLEFRKIGQKPTVYINLDGNCVYLIGGNAKGLNPAEIILHKTKQAKQGKGKLYALSYVAPEHSEKNNDVEGIVPYHHTFEVPRPNWWGTKDETFFVIEGGGFYVSDWFYK